MRDPLLRPVVMKTARAPSPGRHAALADESSASQDLGCCACCRSGCRWTWASIKMIGYVTLLMPGFLQMVVYYVFSSQVRKGIRYGPGPRQKLDIYVPLRSSDATLSQKEEEGGQELKPVVVFVTGGAWTVGYKAWGALLARRLCEQGIVVACLDYRNYPKAVAPQMAEDVNTGIAWVMKNISNYSGDPGHITLVGQSAGAHLGALTLLRQCERAASSTSSSDPGLESPTCSIAPQNVAITASSAGAGRLSVSLPPQTSSLVCASPMWSPGDIRAFVGISGVYDLQGLSEHLRRRGMATDLVTNVMKIDGRVAVDELSPLEVARRMVKHPNSSRLIPEVTLIHGTSDKSAPHEGSQMLHDTLQAQHVACSLRLVEGKGHTAFLLEDPMKGGRDLLVEAVLQAVTGREHHSVGRKLCPAFLCNAAAAICPF